MKAAILSGFEREHPLEDILPQALSDVGVVGHTELLRERRLQVCRGCGACAHRSPGLCILKDEAAPLFRQLAQADWVILLTPIRFGGYSATLKQLVDRFSVLGTPFYKKQGNRLVHPMRYPGKVLLGVGVMENHTDAEAKNFSLTVSRNAENMQYKGHAMSLSLDVASGEWMDKCIAWFREVRA